MGTWRRCPIVAGVTGSEVVQHDAGQMAGSMSGEAPPLSSPGTQSYWKGQAGLGVGKEHRFLIGFCLLSFAWCPVIVICDIVICCLHGFYRMV